MLLNKEDARIFSHSSFPYTCHFYRKLQRKAYTCIPAWVTALIFFSHVLSALWQCL